MKIIWNERSVRWFRNASEYTGYHKKLAKILLELIPTRTTLCDVGCGSGLIDLELAPYFEQVTGVDISTQAIEALKSGANEKGYGNISPVCADASSLEGQWETVTAFFCGGSDVIDKYFHLAKKRLVFSVHGVREGNFGPSGHKVMKRFDVQGVKKELEQRGIQHSLQEVTLEYGQPLSDLQEARDFVAAYAMPMDEAKIDAYLEQSLVKTGDSQFPYYLPNEKKFGIFVVETG